MQFPIPSVDPPSASSSYKEESLLRKDHFEVGASDLSPGQRRGTVSGNNQSTLGSMGRSIMQERLQRRHVSVLYMGKPKQEAAGKTTTPPRVRRPSPRHTDSPSSSGQSGNESTASSKGIAVSPLLRSRSTSSPIVKKVPPPLMRTWHTPPTTGPPTEPLPSPPTSATLQPLLLSSTPRASAPVISPPPSPQKDLPSLPRKDASPTRTPSGAVGQTPPSPLRTAREASGSPALARTPTPMRQDAVRKVLEDENATAEELREALSTQTAKYSRLMAYLLTLTERHGMEKNEFLRRIETLEAEAQRRERELKGLRWLVANANQGGSAGQQGEKRPAGPHPVRADSATLPGSESRSRQRSASESVVGTSAGVRMATGMSASPNPGAGVLDMMRLSIDSPSGSTEDGLLEMQTAISELIAPFISPPTSDASHSGETQGERGTGTQSESLSSSARLRRSNTLPDASLAHLPAVSSKQARRTSSPVLPASNSGSPAKPGAPLARRPAAATGLGFGFELSKGESSSPPRADRDPHARSDSSTLSSVPTLSTFSSSSALSSIPETPRTEMEFSPAADSARKSSSTKQSEEMARRSKTLHRHSGSSLSSSTSSGTGKFTTSSRVSTSPSIAQVLDRGSRQPEMDAILRKLRAFGHREGSP
ncbi:hypothetical protein BC628DRAFT_175044 [Trametes gibbosa]|nr:hypothetical protein BC628DRAFT_175044 [Trametes gibbosa]